MSSAKFNTIRFIPTQYKCLIFTTFRESLGREVNEVCRDCQEFPAPMDSQAYRGQEEKRCATRDEHCCQGGHSAMLTPKFGFH